MKLAVLFDNLGPYHVARLGAVARRCDLLAIEQQAASAEYAWDATPQVPFRRVTLFEQAHDVRMASAFDVDRAVSRALSALAPDAIAVPGWATPLASSAVLRRRAMREASSYLIDAWSPAVCADNLMGLAEEIGASKLRRPALADRVVLELMLTRQGLGIR